jgi:hypothetical protein
MTTAPSILVDNVFVRRTVDQYERLTRMLTESLLAQAVADRGLSTARRSSMRPVAVTASSRRARRSS